MTHHSLFQETTPVYSYTRQQALEDGVLVDVTQTARECGFTIPVALTQAVFDQFVDWSEEDTARQTYQDIKGRLWDVLWMMRMQTKRIEQNGLFELRCIPRSTTSKRTTPIRVVLKALCHGGDKGEPVITVMLPSED